MTGDDTEEPHRVSRGVGRWKRAEIRLRSTYLRVTPPPLLARIDPPLRRVATLVRRAAAAAVYLRHPLTRHVGTCDGAPATVDVWSTPLAPRGLLDVLCDGTTAATAGDTHHLAAIARHAPAADVLIAHTTPIVAPWLRRAGFHVVPGLVRLGGDPAALLAERPHRSGLRGDNDRLRRAQYRVEHWSHSPERSRLFYDRYLVPHVRVRFRERAEVTSFDIVDRFFAAGLLVAVRRAGCAEPDGLGLVVPRGGVLWCMILGTRDADPAILRHGGMAALYLAQIELANARGLRVDFGRCVPWASDGVFQYKLKWGFRPIPDGNQTLEYAVKVLRPESAVARRLVDRGVMIREGRTYRPFTAADLSAR